MLLENVCAAAIILEESNERKVRFDLGLGLMEIDRPPFLNCFH